MDFSFFSIRTRAKFSHEQLSFRKRHSLSCAGAFKLTVIASVLGLSQGSLAATGNAQKGADSWAYLCEHCHGEPQPHNQAAFKSYGKTANPLSLYASNPAAITKAITKGYIIPEGNTNDDYPPGTSTTSSMGSFVGMGDKRMGVGETPTQYAIDISAYLASYFEPPEKPAITSVSAGNAQATVSFSAPKSELTITSYTVTAAPGGVQATGTVSPITVTGLANGTAYTFTVVATSNAGGSKPSAASNAVTPVAPPQAVAIKPAVSAPGVAAPIAASTATNVAAAAVAPTVKSALPSFPSVAPTAVSPALKAATPVAQAAPAQPAAVSFPAPTIVAVRPGSTTARVFFTLPKDVIPLIAIYSVQAYKNGVATSVKINSTGSPIVVTGLTNGEEYTFTVTATSKTGAKATSEASSAVTPLGIFGD